MNALTQKNLVDLDTVTREVVSRDRELDNKFGKDLQIAIRAARVYIGEQQADPHREAAQAQMPAAGPLIAVRLWVLTRKTLGRLETDLTSRV